MFATTDRGERRTAWAFVAAQFVLLAAVVLLPSGTAWEVPEGVRTVGRAARLLGLLLTVAGLVGLGRSLSPFPVPTEAAELKTGGPYRVVRHPIYSGLMLLVAVWATTSGNPLTACAAAGFVVLLAVKARWEEARLLEHFDGYAGYAARTGRFVPLVGRLGS